MTDTARGPADVLEYWSAQGTGVLRPPRLAPEELREVLRTRNNVPLFDFIVTVALVFIPPLALFLYPSIWVGILGALLNVHVFNRCAQIVHGSDHSALFANKRLDIIVGQFSGFFVGYLRQGHKETHDEHHLYLNSEQDADRVWCEPEAKVSSMLRGWVRDLCLISAAYRFMQYIPGRREKSREKNQPAAGSRLTALANLAVSFVPLALVQLTVILAYVAAAGFAVLPGIGYYLLVYILALFVLYPIQIRLRSNVEHSFAPGYQCLKPQDCRVVRSVQANWLEKLIVAPLNYEYHYEHHIIPNMPYYNAPRLRSILLAKGSDIPIAKGYVSFIWHKWLAERELERRARTMS